MNLRSFFATFDAYHPRSIDDCSGQPLDSNLGLFGDINTSSEAALAELKGNDIIQQPEQSHDESDTKSIIIPESAIPDTVSDKCSGKRPAFEPRSPTKGSIDLHSHGFLRRPEKPATCRTYTVRQNSDKSLRDRVNEETWKWIVVGEGRQEQYMCSYPNCSYINTQIVNLKTHIINHTQISRYKCTYLECGDNPYFLDATALRRHVQRGHTHEQPYFCKLCGKVSGVSMFTKSTCT